MASSLLGTFMTTDILNALTKLLFALSLLFISIAVFMFSMGNASALQTAAVHLGMNPVVSFYCYGSSNTYTVPAGSDLILTDISASDLVVKADGTTIWTHWANYSYTSKHASFTTGFVAPSGSLVRAVVLRDTCQGTW